MSVGEQTLNVYEMQSVNMKPGYDTERAREKVREWNIENMK